MEMSELKNRAPQLDDLFRRFETLRNQELNNLQGATDLLANCGETLMYINTAVTNLETDIVNLENQATQNVEGKFESIVSTSPHGSLDTSSRTKIRERSLGRSLRKEIRKYRRTIKCILPELPLTRHVKDMCKSYSNASRVVDDALYTMEAGFTELKVIATQLEDSLRT